METHNNLMYSTMANKILSLFLFSLAFWANSFEAQGQGCDPTQQENQIIGGFHSTILKRTDGTFIGWGEYMANNGTHLLSPIEINATNYPALTGAPLLAGIGSAQNILLTTTGLFAWGAEGAVFDNAITSSATFQKLTINGKTDGLPVGVLPTDVKQLFATLNTIAIVTNNGNGYVISQYPGSRGNGGVGTSLQWYQVQTSAGVNLTNIIEIRGAVSAFYEDLTGLDIPKGTFVAKTPTGLYTWGELSYLGNGTSVLQRVYATPMSLPAGVTVSTIKMFGVTPGPAYIILGTDGKLYSIGANDRKQLGDYTITERLSWVRVKGGGGGGGNFDNASFISVQEHEWAYPGVNAITTSKQLYAWGDNNTNMLGVSIFGWNSDPVIPDGSGSGILYVETGGHFSIIVKENTPGLCYVGHRLNGSMGDGSAALAPLVINTYDCINTPRASICGITSLDAGDAPISFEGNGTTDLANHTNVSNLASLYLGSIVPTSNNFNFKNVVAGTDNKGSNGDGVEEDGLSSAPDYDNSGTYNITVTVRNTTGSNAFLTAWIDWNNDGDFLDPGEQSATSSTVATGSTTKALSWTGVPTNLTTGTKYYLRLRYSSVVVSSPLGNAIDGEIEDYFVSALLTNIPPVANDITDASIPSTAAATPISALTATDTDGTIASYTVSTLPAHGTLYVGGVAVTMGQVLTPAQVLTLTYDPDGTFTGNETFTFTATDDSGAVDATPATFTIPIGNNPPVANDATNASISSTAAATPISALTATDTDGTIASYTVLTLPAHGTLYVGGVAVTMGQVLTPAQVLTLTYDPDGTFTGNETFTFTATDNNGAVDATPATITIPISNNPPVANDATNASIPSTAAATPISALTATDTDGTIASYTVSTLPAHGTLYVGGVAVTMGQVLTPAQVLTLTYDPDGTFTGNETFTFTATDNNGAVDATPATITIPISNTPPVTPATPTASVTVQPTCTTPTGTILITAPALGTNEVYEVTGTSPAVAAQTNTTGNFTGLAPGVYDVTVLNIVTSVESAAVSLTVNALPANPATPTASVTAQPTCTTLTGTIDVTAPALGANEVYEVTGTSPVVAAQTNTTGDFAGLAPGIYGVTVLNTVTGCKSAAVSITINAVPANSIATFSQTASTCTGTTANNNGIIAFATATNVTHFGISTANAATYDGPAFASATAFTAVGQPVSTTVANTGGTYIIRLFNGTSTCSFDQTVTVLAAPCCNTMPNNATMTIIKN